MTFLPKWVDILVVPILSVLLAAAISAIVILLIGEHPGEALKTMITGALGSSYGWGYTLYYTTNFIFTGLAVSVALKTGLFNIGGEGQATLGGLGVALACLYLPLPHWALAIPVAMVAACLFGAMWAVVPAYLQARRGSHIVITTIMFNFLAAALLNYMLVEMLMPAGSMDPASVVFPEATNVPKLSDFFSLFGISFAEATPANVSLFIALSLCVVVWVFIWKTQTGFALRTFGQSESVAAYSGISAFKVTMIAMMISGGISGCMAINNVMGEAERLVMNAAEGAGFIGIAVALIGRSHPLGVVLSAFLFGFLYQGGAELAFWSNIPRELIVVIQALVILFTGALDNMVRSHLVVLGRLSQSTLAAATSSRKGA